MTPETSQPASQAHALSLDIDADADEFETLVRALRKGLLEEPTK